MNRASARARIFHKSPDDPAFEQVLAHTVNLCNIRLLAYIVMPNHSHLVLWPRTGECPRISRFMKWLPTPLLNDFHDVTT